MLMVNNRAVCWQECWYDTYHNAGARFQYSDTVNKAQACVLCGYTGGMCLLLAVSVDVGMEESNGWWWITTQNEPLPQNFACKLFIKNLVLVLFCSIHLLRWTNVDAWSMYLNVNVKLCWSQVKQQYRHISLAIHSQNSAIYWFFGGIILFFFEDIVSRIEMVHGWCRRTNALR